MHVHLTDWGWDSISGGIGLSDVQSKCLFKGNPLLAFVGEIQPLNSSRLQNIKHKPIPIRILT